MSRLLVGPVNARAGQSSPLITRYIALAKVPILTANWRTKRSTLRFIAASAIGRAICLTEASPYGACIGPRPQTSFLRHHLLVG